MRYILKKQTSSSTSTKLTGCLFDLYVFSAGVLTGLVFRPVSGKNRPPTETRQLAHVEMLKPLSLLTTRSLRSYSLSWSWSYFDGRPFGAVCLTSRRRIQNVTEPSRPTVPDVANNLI